MAGPPEQVGVAPESKQGLLWETYRQLAGDGFQLDDVGYSVSFRVKLKVCWLHAFALTCYTGNWHCDLTAERWQRRDTLPRLSNGILLWQDGQPMAELEQALAELPEGLTHSLNRGKSR